MDSLSHVIIGSAIGEAFLGKKIGRWGMLLGAIAKSIPDFDLFYTGLNDPRAYMCEHRAHTHSLFIEALYAIPIAFLLSKLFQQKVSFKQMFIFMLACLWGHSLLDWCTNFGTQLLLPFTNGNYSLNTLSIVDLLFTFPMLIFMTTALFYKKNNSRRLLLARLSLIYCFLYLGLTFYNKSDANKIAEKSIENNKIPAKNWFTNPTMLNNALWYVTASNDSTLFIGEFSLLHKTKPIVWYNYERNQELLNNSKSKDDVKALRWFGDPYTIARNNGDTLNVYAVKFGRSNMSESELEKTFIFHYTLFEKEGKWEMGMKEPNSDNFNLVEGLQDIWARINGKK